MNDIEGLARIRSHPRQVLILFFILITQVLSLSGLGSHGGWINSAEAATFTIDSNSGAATVSQFFAGYHVTSSNPGPSTAYSIAPTSSFNSSGLTFNTSTGTISGIPSVVMAPTAFTIIESSVAGGLQAQLYILTVLPPSPPVVMPDPPQLNSISGISPSSGSILGGSQVTISGSFPSQIAGVQISGIPLSSNSWSQAASAISILMPSHAAGPVSIVLFDGQAPPLADQAFTYVDIPVATPTPTPSATPTPTPSATPTPTPSATPTPTPSATPTPTPSATPTPAPQPTPAPTSSTPSAPSAPALSQAGINVISNGLLSNDSISGPLIALSTQIQVGDQASGKSAAVSATGLLPGSTVYLYIYSTPQLIGSGVVDSTGTANITALIPQGLPTGDHQILAVGTGPLNAPVQAISAFKLDSQSVVVDYAPPAQVSASMAADHSAINKALDAGKPLYDINLHPGAVATVSIAAGSIIALTGSGGGSGGSGGSGGGRGAEGGGEAGEFDSAEVEELEAEENEKPGKGDLSKSWKAPGTSKVDSWINESVVKAGRFSILLPRVLVDGAWARAMFGASATVLWGLGLLMGVLSSVQVHYQALPPKYSFVIVIIALGILDSTAGALAWLAIAGLALATGHVTNFSELRTLLGMFALFATTILVSFWFRPLRRKLDGSLMKRFDRFADYVVPPIFLAFAASSLFKALNGLSGLDLVQNSNFKALTITIIIFFLIRVLMEDITAHWYPKRSLASQPQERSSQTKPAMWFGLVVKLAIFLMVAAPFYGLGKVTFLAFGLTAIMFTLRMFEEDLPKFDRISKWYPLGVTQFLFFTIIGIVTSALVLGSDPSHQKVIHIHALVIVPGVVFATLEYFREDGAEWPDNWEKRILGAEIWFLAVGLLMGFLTL